MKKLLSTLLGKIILYLKKICALNTRQTIFVSVVAVLAAAALTGFNYLLNSHHRAMEISLNYDGAQYGLTPSSGRFDISKIKSDEVIRAAIEKTGDKNLTVENVKPRITIDAKMPKSAIDKTVAAISRGESYSYTPAEFVVYYSQADKFGKNYTTVFLNALAESYNEFFCKTYSDKNNVLIFDNNSEYDGYDYDEICTLLSDKVNSMINYLGQKQESGADFVSAETGFKYSELVTSLINIRDISIEKLNAYIYQNKISKDKPLFLNKKQHLIDNETRKYDNLSGASEISNKILKLYDPRISGVAFVPSVDEENEYYMSRTKTGIDNLSKMSYKNGKQATEVKATIDNYQDKYDNISGSAATTSGELAAADEMITGIENDLKDISALALKTDNEYIARKNNNYVTYSTPGKLSLPVTSLIKYAVLFMIIFVALLRILRMLWQFACRTLIKEDSDK